MTTPASTLGALQLSSHEGPSTSRMKDANDLSSEIWGMVAEYLDAHEFVYLRMTCRFTADVTPVCDENVGYLLEILHWTHMDYEDEFIHMGYYCQPIICMCGDVRCGLHWGDFDEEGMMIAAEEEKAAEDMDLQRKEAMHQEAEQEEENDYGYDEMDVDETEW